MYEKKNGNVGGVAKGDRKETERRTLRYKKLIHEAAKLTFKYESLNPKDWGKKELDSLCQKIYKTLNPITRSRMFNMLNKDAIVKNDIVDAYLKKLDEAGLTDDKEIEIIKRGIDLIKNTTDALNVAKYIAEKRGTTSNKVQKQENNQFNFNTILTDANEDLSINDKTDVLIQDEKDI